jgi:hypothetical protein
MKKNMVSSNISQCLIEPTNVRNTHGVHVLQEKTPKNDTQWQLAYQFSEKSMHIRALGQQKKYQRHEHQLHTTVLLGFYTYTDDSWSPHV